MTNATGRGGSIVGAAVVTGAAHGIGRAAAQRLAERGAHVMLVDLDGAAVDQVADVLRSAGLSAQARTADVAEEGALQQVADEVADEHDLVAWVNDAGRNALAPLAQSVPDLLDGLHRVNVRGYALGIAAAATRMGPGSAIVNVSSVSARIAFANNAAYGATKGAIEALTRHAAVDLASRGIRVNAVAPGSIRTGMTADRLADPAGLAARVARIPLGRIGDPEDVAGPIVFLCTPEAAYITGTVLTVDGGRTIT